MNADVRMTRRLWILKQFDKGNPILAKLLGRKSNAVINQILNDRTIKLYESSPCAMSRWQDWDGGTA